MSDRERYLKQAQYCRDEAALRPHAPETEAIWLKLGAEYDRLAKEAEGHDQLASGRVQQQAMQQQQAKAKE